jgi:flagellar protein FlbT
VKDSTFKVSLKANDRIFINGAVVRVDRRVSLEFLNDVQFLLENHVMQAEEATTPLRQLYFIAQVIVMTPNDAEVAVRLFHKNLESLIDTFSDQRILSELKYVDRMISENRIYEALKTIRGLYPFEEEIMKGTASIEQGEPAEQPLRAVG